MFWQRCSFYVMAKHFEDHGCVADLRGKYKKHTSSQVIFTLLRSKYETLQAGPHTVELLETLHTKFVFKATYWKYCKVKELAISAARRIDETLTSCYHNITMYLNMPIL